MDRGSKPPNRYLTSYAKTSFVDGRLYSPTFNDYYADRDPLGECQRVHLAPGKLRERMCVSSVFTVFEFGFGAALNFLTIGQEFLRVAPPKSRLRFFSCEAYPAKENTLNDLHRSLRIDHHLANDLLDSYPPPVSGIYRRLFADERIELTLYFCLIDQAVNEYQSTDHLGVDAWILDGFAPDRNPAMWEHHLFESMAAKTVAGGTVTSFSVASRVRLGLQNAGYEINCISQQPHKKHSLLGHLAKAPVVPTPRPSDVIVLGGGFAGCATARALARRQISTKIVTLNGHVADQTSGLPRAICHARLSSSTEPQPYFRSQAYYYSHSVLSGMVEDELTGVVQFASKNMPRQRMERIQQQIGERWAREALDLDYQSPLRHDYKIFFPKSFSLSGISLCSKLVEHPRIELISIRRFDQDVDIEEFVMIFATGATLGPIGEAAQCWEVLPVEGQLDGFVSTIPISPLKLTMIKDGFATPNRDTIWVGSTYEYTPWPPGAATQHNLAKLVELTGHNQWKHQAGFRGIRAVTSDKLPIAGQINSQRWVNLAHASSGTTTAPYCAEIVASLVAGEQPPIWSTLLPMINPARFVQRQHRRGNPFQCRS